MFSLRVLFVAYFMASILTTTNFKVALSYAPASTFRLPVMPGVAVKVTQGNNQGDHIADNGSAYAFDFIVGQSNFVVTAVQGGTVIGVNNNSVIQCNGLNSEIAPESKPLKRCWAYANFVLIANDDGKTASLYVHLLAYSDTVKMPKVTVGKHVNQGDPIGLAGTTGWSTGVHLHFQVENIPSISQQQTQPLGWWWTNSLPTTFANPEVLAQDANGIPQTDQSFALSANSSVSTTVPMPPTQIPTTLLITSVNPSDNATNVPLTQLITITIRFNKSISFSEIFFSISPLVGIRTDISGNTLVLTPSELQPNTRYTYAVHFTENKLSKTFSFTTQAANTASEDNAASINDQGNLNMYPDIFVYNRMPYKTNDFSATGDWTDQPDQHYFFRVSFLGDNKNTAKQAFTDWLLSTGLSQEQIQHLDIRYQ